MSIFDEVVETEEVDSPHPALHKTASVTNLPDEVEPVISKHSVDEQHLVNASSDPERPKLSHMKVPMKVDSAPVQTKKKALTSLHPTESDRIRTSELPTDVRMMKFVFISYCFGGSCTIQLEVEFFG